MGLYLGVFLITLSGLIFEIGLTRIFSATIWYHFAFVAISVALLGWGLGGLRAPPAEARRARPLARAGGAAHACSTPLSIPLVPLARSCAFPSRPSACRSTSSRRCVPFFLAGMALSMVFDLHREQTGALYFADLLGASLGALAVTFLLSWLGRRERGARRSRSRRSPPRPASRAGCACRPRPGACSCWWPLVANERTRPLQDPQRAHQGPCTGTWPRTPARRSRTPAGTPTRASTRSTGFAAPYLARLYIDSDAWTSILHWDGDVESIARHARLVPRAAVPARAAAEDAGHRPRRRLGRARGARRGQPRR